MHNTRLMAWMLIGIPIMCAVGIFAFQEYQKQQQVFADAWKNGVRGSGFITEIYEQQVTKHSKFGSKTKVYRTILVSVATASGQQTMVLCTDRSDTFTPKTSLNIVYVPGDLLPKGDKMEHHAHQYAWDYEYLKRKAGQ